MDPYWLHPPPPPLFTCPKDVVTYYHHLDRLRCEREMEEQKNHNLDDDSEDSEDPAQNRRGRQGNGATMVKLNGGVGGGGGTSKKISLAHRSQSLESSSWFTQKKKSSGGGGAVNVFMTNMTLDNLSRHDLVNWVNHCLQANFSHIEELCNGAAYCQFMDMLFPASVPLHRVNFEGNFETDFVQNFKLVQNAFRNLNVRKVIPIEKLVKGRFQDNFEFLQWFKKFFVANYKANPYYNALEARGGVPMVGPAKTLAGNFKTNSNINNNHNNNTTKTNNWRRRYHTLGGINRKPCHHDIF